MPDIIDKWVELVGRITDADPILIHSAGLFLVSTFAMYFRILTSAEISFKDPFSGGKLCNLWIIIIGRTRITRKSTVISKVEDIIDVLMPAAKCSHEFTPEAFITEGALMSNTKQQTTSMIWIQDEVLSTFQKMSKKDGYMTGTDSILSRIYDGKSVNHRTERRGIEILKGPYFTFLVASTEALAQLLNEISFIQGFLNRPIYVFVKKAIWKANTAKSALSLDDEALLKEIKDFLQALKDVEHGVVLNLSVAAREMYDKYDKEIFERIDSQDLGIKEGYTGNLPNLVLKLAGIYRIARMDKTELDDQTLRAGYHIEPVDVQKAVSYVNEVVVPGLEKVVSLINRQYIKNQPVISNKGVYDIIKEYLKTSSLQTKNGEMRNAMIYTDLHRKIPVPSDKFREIINSMAEQNLVALIPNVEMGLGRKPIVVQLVEQ